MVPIATYTFQALALHEARFDLYPDIWALPSTQHAAGGGFAQVWFPGARSDIGGGEDNGFSQYTFVWMASKIQAANLLDLDNQFIKDVVISPMKTKGVLAWDLMIGGRDHLERLHLRIGKLMPMWVKHLLRTAHRNPLLRADAVVVEGESHWIGDTTGGLEQAFHWTVLQRM